MKKYYSSAGDDGYTGLLGEGRVPKYHLRIECVGTIDEATSALGLARASCRLDESKNIILEIQKDLYHMMAEISELPAGFILPGDSLSGAALAVARTVVRRAERIIARLINQDFLQNKEILRYINRLSSLCFLLELYENNAWGIKQARLVEK